MKHHIETQFLPQGLDFFTVFFIFKDIAALLNADKGPEERNSEGSLEIKRVLRAFPGAIGFFIEKAEVVLQAGAGTGNITFPHPEEPMVNNIGALQWRSVPPVTDPREMLERFLRTNSRVEPPVAAVITTDGAIVSAHALPEFP
jgi:hypothetical protein